MSSRPAVQYDPTSNPFLSRRISAIHQHSRNHFPLSLKFSPHLTLPHFTSLHEQAERRRSSHAMELNGWNIMEWNGMAGNLKPNVQIPSITLPSELPHLSSFTLLYLLYLKGKRKLDLKLGFLTGLSSPSLSRDIG